MSAGAEKMIARTEEMSTGTQYSRAKYLNGKMPFPTSFIFE